MNKFFKAMFCVTFFSVATRALGFLLKVYLSRKLTSEMLGSYQVAMSIFAVLMTFVSSGIPVVLSRNVAFFAGKNDKKSIGSIVSSGLILTGIISLTVTLILILFPEIISKIFTSSASSEMIYMLLPALIFSSIYEVLRGALWGEKKFFAISFTEFIEQVMRILIIVILFELPLISMSGTGKTALSLSLACIISSLIVIAIYIKHGGKLSNPKYEFKSLLKTSTPITAVRTVSALVSSIISIIIPLKLMDYGFTSSEALSEFGIITGMTLPLLMIPSTLIGSLAVTIIPSISEQTKNIDGGEIKNFEKLKNKINFSIRTAVIFGGILVPVFAALGIPICRFLFDNNEAGIYLSCASILMIPLGISQITSSILNAVGLEMKSLKNYVISSALLVISIFFLPKYIGTFSLIVGYAFMSITSSALNIKMLADRKLIDFSFIKTIISMLTACIISGGIGYFVNNLLSSSLVLSLIVSGIIVILCEIISIFALGLFSFDIFKSKKLSLKKS
ncbi:MAG: oligosaccharide flippase family protein [Clostridia bacterium]|nr:oligosaccharide flippase family protein [Clostridia bacterium]